MALRPTSRKLGNVVGIVPHSDDEQAVFALRSRLGPVALIPLTQHTRAEIRQLACEGLAGHVESDLAARTIPALLVCSHDPEPGVRTAALRSLEGARGREVADRMLEALSDPHLPACLAAARCLFFQPDERARPGLEALLERSADTMPEVIEALSVLPGTTALLRALSLGDHEARALEAVFGLALKRWSPNRCRSEERHLANEALQDIGQLKGDLVGERARLYLSQDSGPERIALPRLPGTRQRARRRKDLFDPVRCRHSRNQP